MGPVKQGLRVAEQVREVVVRLPDSLRAWDVHRGGCDFYGATHSIWLWLNLTSFILFHVLLHFFVKCVEFLPNWLADEAGVHGRHQVELFGLFLGPVGEDKSLFIPIVDVLHTQVNRGDAVLEVTLLVQRWEEGHLLTHLGEFERLGHALFPLELFPFNLVLLLHSLVILPQVFVVRHHALELSPSISCPVSHLVKVVILVGTRYLFVHDCLYSHVAGQLAVIYYKYLITIIEGRLGFWGFGVLGFWRDGRPV